MLATIHLSTDESRYLDIDIPDFKITTDIIRQINDYFGTNPNTGVSQLAGGLLKISWEDGLDHELNVSPHQIDIINTVPTINFVAEFMRIPKVAAGLPIAFTDGIPILDPDDPYLSNDNPSTSDDDRENSLPFYEDPPIDPYLDADLDIESPYWIDDPFLDIDPPASSITPEALRLERKKIAGTLSILRASIDQMHTVLAPLYEKFKKLMEAFDKDEDA